MTDRTREHARFWPWLLLLVVALGVAVLLAWRPWAADGAEPDAAPTGDATATGTTAPATPTSSGAPSAGSGAFDGESATALFLTDAELAEAVPAAAGLALADAEEARWGLPARSAVEPPGCTPAVTVVEQQPDAFLRRFASGEAVTVIQSVAVLPDAAAAGAAFDALVGTLADCPEYQQVNPGVDGGAWVAEPPVTERGAVSTTVRRLTLSAEGATSPEVEVTALAGNALVTTTVSGVDPAAEPAAPEALARVARAAAERALTTLG